MNERSQTKTILASSKRAVEAKGPRLNFGVVDVTLTARKLGGIEFVLPVSRTALQPAANDLAVIADTHRVVDRFQQTIFDTIANDDSISDGFDGVRFFGIQHWQLIDVVDGAIDSYPNKAFFADRFKNVLMGAGLFNRKRRQDHDFGSFGQLKNAIANLNRSLLLNQTTAAPTMNLTNACH